MLYVLSTISFVEEWAFAHHAFIQHGDNCYTVFRATEDFSPWWEVNQIVGAITGGITMLLADIAIVCQVFSGNSSGKNLTCCRSGAVGLSGVIDGEWFSYQCFVPRPQWVSLFFISRHTITYFLSHENHASSRCFPGYRR